MGKRSPAVSPRLWIPGGVLGLLLLLAVLANVVSPYDPTAFEVVNRLASPSAEHWLGTDQFGRDVLSRLIFGARASLQVSILATLLACVVGVTLGLFGGYFGGLVELLTVRVADIILSFPPIVLAILFVTLFGPGIPTLVFVIAVLYVPTFARIAYGQVLTVRTLDYVEAMRAIGAHDARIIVGTVLPNISAPIIVQFTLTAGVAILLESGLSFLGLGIVPPTPSWGAMIGEARAYMLRSPLNLLWPCIVITVTIMALNNLGDALRDWFDPRLRRRAALPQPAARATTAPASPAAEGRAAPIP